MWIFMALALFASVQAEQKKIIFIGSPDAKIVGGEKVNITQYPHQVSLYYKSDNVSSFICGGSILSPNVVLTAAHCVHNKSEGFYIKAGIQNLLSVDAVIRSVIKISVHRKYNHATSDYDIALLSLNENLVFGNTIQAIPIASKEPQEGEQLVVTGFGVTMEDSPNISYDLMGVIVPVYNRVKCEEVYSSLVHITSRMFCAGIKGKDSCQGDSGGPAVCGDELCGVVSFGIGCGRDETPGVYANLADPGISDFINSIVY